MFVRWSDALPAHGIRPHLPYDAAVPPDGSRHADLPAHRPHSAQPGPAEDPLVRPDVPVRLRHRLRPGAVARQAHRLDPGPGRRPGVLRRHGRDPRRPPRLCLLLRFRPLPQRSALAVPRLGRRHELPRRLPRRAGGGAAVRAPLPDAVAADHRPAGRDRTARAVLRPHRQLHRRRALGPSGQRPGLRPRHGVPARGPAGAPPVAALRGGAGRAGAVHRAVRLHAERPAAHGAVSHLPDRLRPGALHRRVLPRA
ncbi:UNVERIFIED_CONTAM: hypothetical protein NCL1_03704 [Trichonephila clavipes]